MPTPAAGTDAVRVTEDVADPPYDKPFIDVNELRRDPVPHRYVNGGFTGTDARFSFYFPPAARYEGRFHHNTYPLATTSDIGPFPIAFEVATGNLGFTLDSGAYYVQTNMGGAFRQGDPSVAAYRVNAAAAKYSRVVAAEIYARPHRPFGYLYGGSGGAYQTIGGAEHTVGVWDGFMPFVLGSNNAVPSLWSARLHALRILGKRNKFPGVVDAIAPGGSGDMYAGLNDAEQAALKEATLMGFPTRGWYNHETLHNGYFSDIFAALPARDPTYVTDFWRKPGYLGADPAADIAADRFAFETTLVRIVAGMPACAVLATAPDKNLGGAHVTLLSGAGAGKQLHIATADGTTVRFAAASDPAVLQGLQPGDKVRIDNSWILAAQTYQRHQVPPSPDEYGWNQFRDAAGKPIYPQRDVLIGHGFARDSVGSLLSGRIHGKMLLVQALMDIDALPWCADWYRAEVKKAMGARADDSFALWFIDHTQHDNPLTPAARAHTVSLAGALQQGLRDLARWVEAGVRPSATAYTVTDTQVHVPARAAERKGVQPVITLTVNGGVRAEVAVGEKVTFTAVVEVPAGAGKVVAAAWDFEGSGTYTAAKDFGPPQEVVELATTLAYARPGTYFPVLRAASHRTGDTTSPYARVENLARVRVVVK